MNKSSDRSLSLSLSGVLAELSESETHRALVFDAYSREIRDANDDDDDDHRHMITYRRLGNIFRQVKQMRM